MGSVNQAEAVTGAKVLTDCTVSHENLVGAANAAHPVAPLAEAVSRV
ncbi:MAG TPA: hypothetical protein VKH45_14780 [Candidatus Acidoferrum sp.]|nr:hypothetical protein [Candidatus Acidoferrum sp.]